MKPLRPYNAPVTFFRVEYEIPPTRAVHWVDYYDDGQTEDEVSASFAAQNLFVRVRKVTRCVEVGGGERT